MAKPESPEAIPDPGTDATEAFGVLGNETRLGILLELWKATDPNPETQELSFTALRDRVGIRQGSQFNYHLDKLVDRFVDRTDTGYTLTHTGEKFIQTIIGRTSFDSPTLDREPIDFPCRHCGGQTAITYRDEWLYRVCTECPGTFEDPTLPEGCLSAFDLPPAALTDRSPEELFAIAKFHAIQKVHNQMEGICPQCSAQVIKQLDICHDHTDDGRCPACGRTDPVRVHITCPVCKDWSLIPVPWVLFSHPQVLAFFDDHDIRLQWNVEDLETIQRYQDIIFDDVTILDDDPVRMEVTLTAEDDTLTVTLSEDLEVLDIVEGPAT